MNTKSNQKKKIGMDREKIKIPYIKNNNLVKREFLGVGITNEKQENILEFIRKSILTTHDNYYIVTPNPEILVYTKKHPQFKTILNNAQIALCDGSGLVWGGKVLGISFKQRITGVDFMEKLCETVKDWPITVGFLGARGGVAEQTAQCLLQKYPALKVVFAESEWPEKTLKKKEGSSSLQESSQARKSDEIKDQSQREIANYRIGDPIDILFVAYGFPKQEEWMANHLNKIPVRVMMGVGGAFDYISGNVERAPRWVRFLGFEWLFRLIRQPWRWRRQRALFTFIRLILLEKFKR